MKHLIKLLLLSVLFLFISCSSSDLDDIENALDVANGIERKEIDVASLGLNAFGNKREFGSICEQYRDIKNNFKIKKVRILLNWNNDIQSSRGAAPNFSFYDDVLDCIPEGVDVLAVVNGLPSWMANSSNWIAGNPRDTFLQLWFKKVINRYGNSPKIIAFQVWNEPNNLLDPENEILSFNDAMVYLEFLANAYSISKDISSKSIINAATTGITQNYPETKDYNQVLIDNGIENFTDFFAIHYYGQQFENLLRPDGVKGMLNSLNKSIWITESGRQGTDNQLQYVEETWPYLREQIPNIDRIYYYQYGSIENNSITYGLRTVNPDRATSDLAEFLLAR